MPYQVPKENHPWRRYKNKRTTTYKDREDIVPIKVFLLEIAQHWETYEVITNTPYQGTNFHTLSTLPQAKAASWISGILRRYYVENKGPEQSDF